MQPEERLLGQRFNNGTVVKFAGRTNRTTRKELVWELKCDCGNSYEATSSQLVRCLKKSCGCHRKTERSKHFINDTGERYGKLVVIDIEGNKNPSGVLYRKCLCDCGQETYVVIAPLKDRIKKGFIPSCGCNKKRQGKDHPLYKGYEDISLRYWSRTKLNAKNRDKEFDITIEQAWKQWEKQDKKCALSGLGLLFGRSKGNNATASLDRVDSSKGYILGNIQWIHKDINKMKSDFTDERFIEICKAVVRNIL